MTINIPNFHLNSIGPELILTVTAIVILLWMPFPPEERRPTSRSSACWDWPPPPSRPISSGAAKAPTSPA